MRVIFVNGTVGAGKTTTVDAVGMILRESGIKHALIDLDGLGRAWPIPDDDPFNTRLAHMNLAAMSDTYRVFGAELLIVAGVLEDADDREHCEAMVGDRMTVVRLRPFAESIRERLRKRTYQDAAAGERKIEHSQKLQGILDDARVDDAVVEVGAELPVEVAKKVLAAAGLAG